MNTYFFLSGAFVFASLLAVAICLNEGVHSYFVLKGIDETFNMFFISRFFPCTLPVLSNIYKVVPYPIFLLLYIIAIMLAASAIYLCSIGIGSIAKKRKKELNT